MLYWNFLSNAAYHRAIFWESCNLILKLGQDSSKIEASWPEHLLGLLVGTQFSSGTTAEDQTTEAFYRFVALVFHLPEILKRLFSKDNDTAVCFLETLHSMRSLLRMFALNIPELSGRTSGSQRLSKDRE